MKLLQGEEVIKEFTAGGLAPHWILIIGIGELLAAWLFIIRATQRLGAVLRNFGGAILFHMSHSQTEHQNFSAPAAFLIVVWVLTWL